MTVSSRPSSRGRLLLFAFALLVVAVVFLREPILRDIGRALVQADPISHADAIVLTVDTGIAGVLAASDLVREGVADRVAIFGSPPTIATRELNRRGVFVDSASVQAIRLCKALGVRNVEEIAISVSGTEAEGTVLPVWCREKHLSEIIVVTTTEHSRRVGRVLRRQSEGRIRIMIAPATFSMFRPEGWWKSRDGVRTAVVEIEKLLLDVLSHPLS